MILVVGSGDLAVFKGAHMSEPDRHATGLDAKSYEWISVSQLLVYKQLTPFQYTICMHNLASQSDAAVETLGDEFTKYEQRPYGASLSPDGQWLLWSTYGDKTTDVLAFCFADHRTLCWHLPQNTQR